MSLDDIKNPDKLRSMLRVEMRDNDYLKACCEETGKELEKFSFTWDNKEKNLVIQAMYLNDSYTKALNKLKEIQSLVMHVTKDNNIAVLKADIMKVLTQNDEEIK